MRVIELHFHHLTRALMCWHSKLFICGHINSSLVNISFINRHQRRHRNATKFHIQCMASLKSCYGQNDSRNLPLTRPLSLSIAFSSIQCIIHLKCTEIRYRAHKVHPRQIWKLSIFSGFLFWDLYIEYISFKGDPQHDEVQVFAAHSIHLYFIAIHRFAFNTRWLWENSSFWNSVIESLLDFRSSIHSLSSAQWAHEQKIVKRHANSIIIEDCYLPNIWASSNADAFQSVALWHSLCSIRGISELAVFWMNQMSIWIPWMNSIDAHFPFGFRKNSWNFKPIRSFWDVFFKFSGQQTRRKRSKRFIFSVKNFCRK